jgi:hypothetical protein
MSNTKLKKLGSNKSTTQRIVALERLAHATTNKGLNGESAPSVCYQRPNLNGLPFQSLTTMKRLHFANINVAVIAV